MLIYVYTHTYMYLYIYIYIYARTQMPSYFDRHVEVMNYYTGT